MLAATPPGDPRDGAMAALSAAMVLESGIEAEEAARFVRAAVAPSGERERLDPEAAAWLARAHARLAGLFRPEALDPEALGIVPRDLPVEARSDGTLRIDLAGREMPDRIAFGNGGDLPVHALGRYRLSPGEIGEAGGGFEVETRLLRDAGEAFEETDTLALRESGFLVVEAMVGWNERVRAILHAPPGVELAPVARTSRAARLLDPRGWAGEVIVERGRLVTWMLPRYENNRARAVFAVTPAIEGEFAWPGAILDKEDGAAGWSAAFRLKVERPDAER